MLYFISGVIVGIFLSLISVIVGKKINIENYNIVNNQKKIDDIAKSKSEPERTMATIIKLNHDPVEEALK